MSERVNLLLLARDEPVHSHVRVVVEGRLGCAILELQQKTSEAYDMQKKRLACTPEATS
jgi:hypothetical protein